MATEFTPESAPERLLSMLDDAKALASEYQQLARAARAELEQERQENAKLRERLAMHVRGYRMHAQELEARARITEQLIGPVPEHA